MGSVVANLDEPGSTRYIRVAVVLELSRGIDQSLFEHVKAREYLLRDYLIGYLAGLTLEDIIGKENLKDIQLEILDSFNKLLSSEGEKRIVRVLFKEFAVQ